MSVSLIKHRLESTRELDILAGKLQELVAGGELEASLVSDIMIIVDEVISNLFKYGGGQFLDVSLSRKGNDIELLCLDDGSAFNPLKSDRANMDLPIEQREIGGLGLELILALTADQYYLRKNEYNHLFLTLSTS
ncbi:ATP-binding protein [Gilvimarinus chinensis]|uniref:ATP-binding protein n=1 Tax=Gilvimarinus chinensis TaxID=396005 RepID=UPI0003603589|nr:ATP-binding protein [Gilvimarinus chinensis]